MFYFVAPVIAVICLVVGFKLSRQVWNLIDTPSVTPSGAIIGLCEINGKASTELDERSNLKALTYGPVSGRECVWSSVLVERFERHDKSSSWVKLYEAKTSDGFRIVDRYGGIFVDPKNAKLYLTKSITESESQVEVDKAVAFFRSRNLSPQELDASKWVTSPDGYYMYHPTVGKYIPYTYVSKDRFQYFDDTSQQWLFLYKQSNSEALAESFKDFIGALGALSKEQLRVTETLVTPMQDIYAHGVISFPQEYSTNTELVMGEKGKKKSTYYISTSGEESILKDLKLTRIIVLVIGALASMFTAGEIFLVMSSEDIADAPLEVSNLTKLLIPLTVLAVLFVAGFIVMKLGRTYNRFVRLKQQVEMSSSTIDIVLKRRSSLIPKLKDVIDEASAHEANLQVSLTELRSVSDDQVAKTIFAIGEAYPDLKVSPNFMQLQFELGRTEEKIAMARSFLNDSVLGYNNLRATITGIIYSPFFPKISQ